ncbi:LytR family transcriptional regulator [Streptomyces sp. NP160]|uniref:LytR C-terminal domain-containing protein n=1 Tax=Streptomyces sp. NP160 TaxID=2586637 RepID=UPI00111BA99F|nr:LytR C-terminal domain-containing protein [Streptomyces sp. NP160]TNM64329.1 LytR family transcriptional regulator [Streptomyces sp. NP160]
MSSPYPRDDFDAVAPPRDGRRGAHRAAPRRPGGVLAPVVIALVVVAAGGAGYAAWSTVGDPAASASAAPAAAGEPATDPAAADPAADPAASAAASPADPPSSSAPAAPDRSAPVVVLNGTRTTGLAAEEASELGASGWEVASTGNATAAQRSAHTTTTVLHPTAELEGAAKALAADIGAGAQVALDPDAQAGSLTVVLR